MMPPRASAALFPRLAYVGDVPVEDSHHGSALLYRLLQGYPSDKLQIVEGNLHISRSNQRLPGVVYSYLKVGETRWLNTRLHGYYSTWLWLMAATRSKNVSTDLEGFRPEAILTVGHGYSWLTAAMLAKRLRIPLHLIIHDDWPRLTALPSLLKPYLDRSFGNVYRASASQLCVSPFMVEDYRSRYGPTGQVLLPSRSVDCPQFETVSPHTLHKSKQIVVGYGGNNNPDVMDCLKDLARALEPLQARLCVFGGFTTDQQESLKALCSRISFHGLVPFKQMIVGLREAADVLFVPMSFNEADKSNMSLSFPSKLADYSAVGLPILIYGPVYCSAVRWAQQFPGVAEVVVERSSLKLVQSLSRLVESPETRETLALQAMEIGRTCFGHEKVQRTFYAALQQSLAVI
jgi:glycosyltransferase involved in cell wall biosynthesis